MIFCALDKPIGRVKVLCINTKNNGAFPLGLTCLERLNVIVVAQLQLMNNLKDLTHMFCFRIPCYKLYKEGSNSYVLTIKYMCHFGMR
jgi:hypothetical protein